MNHYINLLDQSEITYKSSGGMPPVLKPLGMGVVVLVIVMMLMQYQGLRRTADKGELLETTWERIEKDVEAAKVLNDQNVRLTKALQTLQGWPVSQHNYADLIEYFFDQAPISPEDIQFTRFSFDEDMLGMRNQFPSGQDATFHPMKRQIVIRLQGVIRTDRPQRRLPEFRRRIAEGEGQPSEISDVILSNPVILEDEQGNPTGISEFSLNIELKDKEITP